KLRILQGAQSQETTHIFHTELTKTTSDKDRAQLIEFTVDLLGEEKAKKVFQEQMVIGTAKQKLDLILSLKNANMPYPAFNGELLNEISSSDIDDACKHHAQDILANDGRNKIFNWLNIPHSQYVVESMINGLAANGDPQNCLDIY